MVGEKIGRFARQEDWGSYPRRQVGQPAHTTLELPLICQPPARSLAVGSMVACRGTKPRGLRVLAHIQ